MPTVRIFGYPGIQQMPNVLPKQYSADSIYTLVQPYIFAQAIVVSGAAASSAADTDDNTMLLRIEVPDDVTVAYEINPPNRTGGVVAATANSPRLVGKDQFYFRKGWTVSLLDVTDTD